MGNEILMLDDIGATSIAERLPGKLGREIKLVTTIIDAREELTGNRDRYGGMIVEPFIGFNYQSRTPLLDFLHETRTERGLIVVAYTTQHEHQLQEQMGLMQGTHYDAYVLKMQQDSSKVLKATLDSLLPS